MSKDFHVTFRVRNNHVLSRRKKLGMSQKELADACGIRQSDISAYECMNRSPVDRKGKWREDATILSAYFMVDEEDLWPDVVLDVEKTVFTAELGGDELQQLAAVETPRSIEQKTPEELAELSERLVMLQGCIADLDENKRVVIEGRLDGKTLKQIGEGMGLGTERVRQIEGSAMRELRHYLVPEEVDPCIALEKEEKRRKVLKEALHAHSYFLVGRNCYRIAKGLALPEGARQVFPKNLSETRGTILVDDMRDYLYLGKDLRTLWRVIGWSVERRSHSYISHPIFVTFEEIARYGQYTVHMEREVERVEGGHRLVFRLGTADFRKIPVKDMPAWLVTLTRDGMSRSAVRTIETDNDCSGRI